MPAPVPWHKHSLLLDSPEHPRRSAPHRQRHPHLRPHSPSSSKLTSHFLTVKQRRQVHDAEHPRVVLPPHSVASPVSTVLLPTPPDAVLRDAVGIAGASQPHRSGTHARHDKPRRRKMTDAISVPTPAPPPPRMRRARSRPIHARVGARHHRRSPCDAQARPWVADRFYRSHGGPCPALFFVSHRMPLSQAMSRLSHTIIRSSYFLSSLSILCVRGVISCAFTSQHASASVLRPMSCSTTKSFYNSSYAFAVTNVSHIRCTGTMSS
jgi:hypothetical protein